MSIRLPRAAVLKMAQRLAAALGLPPWENLPPETQGVVATAAMQVAVEVGAHLGHQIHPNPWDTDPRLIGH